MIDKIIDKIKDFIGKKEDYKLDDDWVSPYSVEIESDKVIKIDYETYKKLYYYTCATKGEISGLGKVKIKGNDIIVSEIVIFEQMCSGASTTLDQKELSKFIVNLVKNKQSPADWKLWWHSHANMGASWSCVDDNNIDKLSKNSTLISICTDNSGYMVGRIDEKGVTSHIPILVMINNKTDEELRKKCEKEVKQKVKDEVFVYTPYQCNYDYSGYKEETTKTEEDNTQKGDDDGLHKADGFIDYE